MNDKEIENLFYSNPEKLFSIINNNGGDLEDFKNLQISKILIKERFPSLINKNYEDAVEFLFWFTFYIEREIDDSVLFTELTLGRDKISTQIMIDDMTFGDKINFIKDNYVDTKDGKDKYILFLREIKTLRNHMAHGELDKLTYGGYFLSDSRGQLKLLINLVNSSLKRKLV